MPSNANDRSLGQMFADLSRDTRALIQQEIQLAKTELVEKASSMVKAVVLVGAGGALLFGSLMALIAMLMLLLVSFGLSPWVASLSAALVVAALGYALIRVGLARFRVETLKPRQTIETLKEDAQWLKSQTK